MTPLKRKAGQVLCAAPWAGGKRTLAPRINAELGPHTHYYAPFVGGFSTEMQKPRCAVEVLNDANPKIANVLTCLRDKAVSIFQDLGPVTFDKSVFLGSLDALSNPGSCEDWEVAADQLIVWWMGANGFAGTNQKPWFAKRHPNRVSGKLTGGCPSRRWESFKASVPAISERLQSVEITNLDFRGFFETCVCDSAGHAAYVDPPYLVKSFEYEHDFQPQDHRDLARILNLFQHTRLVVSYRDEVGPEGLTLAELYPAERWRRVRLDVPKNLASAGGGRTAKRNVEVLLVNDLKD